MPLILSFQICRTIVRLCSSDFVVSTPLIVIGLSVRRKESSVAYIRVRPSVGPSVGPSVRPSVRRSVRPSVGPSVTRMEQEGRPTSHPHVKGREREVVPYPEEKHFRVKGWQNERRFRGRVSVDRSLARGVLQRSRLHCPCVVGGGRKRFGVSGEW